MVFGDGSLGGEGQKGGGLINRIHALVKETPKRSQPPLPSEDTVRRQPSMNQEAGPHELRHLPVLMLDLQPPELQTINFCHLSSPVCGILLYQKLVHPPKEVNKYAVLCVCT